MSDTQNIGAISVDTGVAEVAQDTEQTQATAEGALEAQEAKVGEEVKKIEEAPKQEDKFAAKFAALSRKERQLREREKAVELRLKKLEQDYKQKETELSSKFIDPSRLKKESLQILKEQGITFEQLAEMALNDGKPTPEMMQSELEKKLVSKIEELEKKLEERETKAQETKYEEILNNFTGELTNFVNSSNDYELIQANNAVGLVYEVIEEHHASTGKILDMKAAADAVENYLLEEAKKQLSLNKIKGLVTPKVDENANQSPKKSSVTLTNSAAATASAVKSARPMSQEESLREAAKLIRWDD